MPLSGQSAKFETEGNNSTEAEETATTFDETNNEVITIYKLQLILFIQSAIIVILCAFDYKLNHCISC